MESIFTWQELMVMPARLKVWRHGILDTRDFDKLADAISFARQGLREGTCHVESIMARDGSVWDCD